MSEIFPSENLQRVGFLAIIPRLLRRFGADPEEVLAAAGLPVDALDNADAVIPFAAAGRLLQLSADRTQCPHFGLEMAQPIRTASLGIVGELMRNSPTVGAALRNFAAHQHRNAHGGVVYLVTANDTAFFGYAVYQQGVAGHQIICDAAALGSFNFVSELAQPGPQPVVEVWFSRSEPLDLAPYRRLLGANLRFNAEQTAVVLPRELLDRPVAGADAARLKQIEKQIVGFLHSGELDSVTQLRRELRIALLRGKVSVDEVSAQLGTSRRTLHRRLHAWGMKFQKVLDETRCEFAQQLLSDTNLGAGEIGLIVGYKDPSVFTRMFRRCVGVSPSQWRAELHRRSEHSTATGASAT